MVSWLLSLSFRRYFLSVEVSSFIVTMTFPVSHSVSHFLAWPCVGYVTLSSPRLPTFPAVRVGVLNAGRPRRTCGARAVSARRVPGQLLSVFGRLAGSVISTQWSSYCITLAMLLSPSLSLVAALPAWPARGKKMGKKSDGASLTVSLFQLQSFRFLLCSFLLWSERLYKNKELSRCMEERDFKK